MKQNTKKEETAEEILKQILVHIRKINLILKDAEKEGCFQNDKTKEYRMGRNTHRYLV